MTNIKQTNISEQRGGSDLPSGRKVDLADDTGYMAPNSKEEALVHAPKYVAVNEYEAKEQLEDYSPKEKKFISAIQNNEQF